MNKSRVSSLTIKQLRAFVTVYQLRGLSAAASQLFVTQSAVSVLIRQMEQDLGVTLFDRTTRSLEPTAVAHEAIEAAQRVLRDIDALGRGLSDLSTIRRGRVAITCTPTLAEALLPAAISEYLKRYPDIHINIDDCAPENFTARVLGEHADFGVGTPDRAGGVQKTRLMSDYVSIVYQENDPLASKKVVRWKDIDGLPIITVRPGYGIRSLIAQSAAQAGIFMNVQHEVSLMSTALWMTSCGLGPSVMPATYARNCRIQGLAVKPLVYPKISRDIYVLVRTGRSLSPPAEKFVEVLKESVEKGFDSKRSPNA